MENLTAEQVAAREDRLANLYRKMKQEKNSAQSAREAVEDKMRGRLEQLEKKLRDVYADEIKAAEEKERDAQEAEYVYNREKKELIAAVEEDPTRFEKTVTDRGAVCWRETRDYEILDEEKLMSELAELGFWDALKISKSSLNKIIKPNIDIKNGEAVAGPLIKGRLTVTPTIKRSVHIRENQLELGK